MFAVPGWSLGAPKTEEPYTEKNLRKRKGEHISKRDSTVAPKDATGTSDTLSQIPQDRDRDSNSTTGRRVGRKAGIGGFDNYASHSRSTHRGKRRRQRHATTDRSDSPPSSGQTWVAPHGKIATSESKNVPGTAKQTVSTTRDTQSNLTPIQSAMRQKLISARFRYLNQTLYTSPSAEAKSLFESNPTFFDEYHTGFRQQMLTWPENPADSFVQELKSRGKFKPPGKDKANPQSGTLHVRRHPALLPRTNGVCTIADLGCGDGRIASLLQNTQVKLSLRILSFDLQSSNHFVTKADISNLPLEASSVDVAILCLALMGTNWISFVEEAWRILCWKGELWIAEIKSRFGHGNCQRVNHSVGNKKRIETQPLLDYENDQNNQRTEVDGSENNMEKAGISSFAQVLERRGFVLQAENGIDTSNKMFVKLRFLKAKIPTKGRLPDGNTRPGRELGPTFDETSVLKPCLYKIR